MWRLVTCLERVRMSLAIVGAWFLIRLRVSTVYFVNFGQVFHNDAVVQKLKKSMCHRDWTFVCLPVKFQVIILRGGVAITVETGRWEGEAKHYAAPSPRVALSRRARSPAPGVSVSTDPTARPSRHHRPQHHKFPDLAQYLVLNLCARSHQVPQFVLLHSPRNRNLRMGGADGTLAPPTTAQIPRSGLIFSAEFVLSIPSSPRICAATQPEKSYLKVER